MSFETVNFRCPQQWAKQKMQTNQSTTEGRHDGIGIPSALRRFAVVNKNRKTEPMKLIKSLTFAALAALAVTLRAAATDEANHEAWMIDQSNTYDSDANGTLDSGGTLYIYDGKDLAAIPQKIDLGGAIAECLVGEAVCVQSSRRLRGHSGQIRAFLN